MNQARTLLVLLASIALTCCDSLSFSSTRISKKPISASTLSRPSSGSFSSSSQALFQSLTSTSGGGSFPSYDKIDVAALIKYPLGLAGQMALIFGFLTGVDKLLATFSIEKLPLAVIFLFLYGFNLKSSLFSILPNKKSDGRKLTQEQWEYNKRKIPSWTPPGIAFVFGWPLLTFGLRAYTGAMIVQSASGKFATPAIMSLMLHLGIGNLWNTVNNVERRLGVSVILLYGMWLTKAFAAWQFYQIDPMAGKLLAISLTWISAACALETRTWQINPDLETGKLEPLLPRKHPKWITQFRWEQQ